MKTVSNAKATSLIVDRVDGSDLQVIGHKPDFTRGAMKGAKDLGATDGEKVLGLELVLRRPAELKEAVKTYRSQTQDPKSPMYGQTVTPAEFAKNLGLSGADLTTLTEWLQQQGLNVVSVDNGRLAISFTGTVAQVESAFQTSIHNYATADGTEHFAPAADVQIPAALAPAVTRINGLDNLRVFAPTPFAAPVTDFATGTVGEKLALTGGGKAVQPNLSGMPLKEASFTASKYSMPVGGTTTLNLRLDGLNHPVTGTVSVTDNGKVVTAFDISSCHSYDGGYGRSCTADYTGPSAGSHALTVTYSGDEFTRGARLSVVANFSGSTTTYTVMSPATAGPETAALTYFIATSWTGSAQATGTVTIGGDFGTLGTATFPASGSTTSSGTGNDWADDPYTYNCTYNAGKQTVYCQIDEEYAGYGNTDGGEVLGAFDDTISYSGDTNYAGSSGASYVYWSDYTPSQTPTITTSSTLTAGTYGLTTSESAITYTLTGASGDGNPGGSTSRNAAANEGQFVQLAGPTTGTGTSQQATSQIGAPLESSAYSTSCAGVSTDTCTESTSAFTMPAVVTPATYALVLSYSGDADCARCLYGVATTTISYTENKQTPTFTSVTASPADIVQGTSVAESLSANLTWLGVGTAPTGAVTFKVVNGTAISGSPFAATCGAETSSGAGNSQTNYEVCTASVPAGTVAALATGTYTVTALYAADTNYAAATSSTATFTVGTQGSALAASPSSVVYGQGTTVALTYTISGASSLPAPSGSVVLTLSSGLTAISTITVNTTNCPATTSGSTTSYACQYTWTPPAGASGDNGGTYTITGAYSGDGNYTAQTATASFAVTTAPVTVTLSPSTTQTIALNGTVTFTVAGSWTGSGVTPTGTVSLTCNASSASACLNLPSVTLNGTNCTISTSAKTFSCTLASYEYDSTNIAFYGAYYMVGNYSGDKNYSVGASSPTEVIVSQGNASTTTITANPTSVVYGAGTSVKYTIKVTNSTYANIPTGSVTISGTAITGSPVVVQLSTCTSSSGTETCTANIVVPAATAVGSNTVTAAYSGDGIYAASSGTATVTVTAATPTFGTMTFSPVSSVAAGTSEAITISDTVSYTGPAAPTGAVTYVLNGVTYTASCTGSSPLTCTATVPAATIAALTTNTYTVTAAIAALGNYKAATGASGTFTVTAAPNLTFTSVSHNFGTVAVGTAATDYTLKVTNTGTAAYPFVLNFTAANGFTSATNCPASIAVNGTCEIAFYFTPTSDNTVTATWSLTPEAGFIYAPSNGGTLTGSGTGQSGLSLSTAGHNWGTVTTGTTSAAYGVTLSNSTSSAVTLTLGSVTSPFASATNCGATLAAGASCQFQFTFTPTSTSTVQQVYSISAGGVTITSGGNTVTGITLTGN